MHNGSVPRTVAFRARFLSAVNNVVKVGMSESKRLFQKEVHVKCCRTPAYIGDAGELFCLFVRWRVQSLIYYRIRKIIFGAHKAQKHLHFLCTQGTKIFALRCPKFSNNDERRRSGGNHQQSCHFLLCPAVA